MMFGLSSFNLINEFERASNEPNAEQLASSLARLQPYLQIIENIKYDVFIDHFLFLILF